MITSDTAEATDGLPRFYTLKEAAARLNLKPWQLRRMARRGDLQLYFVGNKRVRVILAEIVDAIRRSSGQNPGDEGDGHSSHSKGGGHGSPPSTARSLDHTPTIKDIAHLLGKEHREIAGAVNGGEIPLKNATARRPRIRHHDLAGVIDATREGGDQ